MKNVYFVFVILLLTLSNLFSQPSEYKSQFINYYLVNYYAIKSDYFLTKLAYKRFSFLDEASEIERRFIRFFDNDYLILYYKDIVALHTFYSEFNEMNLQEFCFLHASEPASLCVLFDNDWKFRWMNDRRFSLGTVKYRLYWGMDSSNVINRLDTTVNTTELSVKLPKTALWAKVKTIIADSIEIDYSFPIQLLSDKTLPMYVPITLERTKLINNSFSVNYKFRLISKIKPDSVWLFVDENSDNQFSQKERYTYANNFDTLVFSKNYNGVNIKTGLECYMICFKDGKQIRYPQRGAWTSNVNNRCMNQTYEFYVMNITNQLWWKVYTNIVSNALTNNYNGLFADDTWTRVGNWGVDANPPVDYSDSTWYNSIFNFLKHIKASLKEKPLIFNGLSDARSLKFLEIADGGMDEGFAHNPWSGYLNLDSWKASCNRGIICRNIYNKKWIPLSVLNNLSPRQRLYSLSSFLLVADSNSYFAAAPNYQTFAHFPEFDIPTGKPMTNAINSIDELQKKDDRGKLYYKREFEKCIVYVNPNPKDTIILDELDGKYEFMVDSPLTIEGGKTFTIQSNSLLMPQSSKIILKTKTEKPNLQSPIWRNPIAKIIQKNDEELTFEFSVEIADSSSDYFKSNPKLPFYVIADLTSLGITYDLELKNDGTKANPRFSKYNGKIDIPTGISMRDIKIPFIVFSATGLISVGYVPLTIENIDTTNNIPNFSFEFDVDFDSKPDGWSFYKPMKQANFEYDTIPGNAKHLRRSIKFINNTERDSCGLFTKIYLPRGINKPIKIAGWSKALNVSGKPNNDYSIYVDFFHTDGTPWYGKTAKFSTGTHDWEYSESIYTPEKPLDYAIVYCLFRSHSGIVWFDNIFLGFDEPTTILEENNINDVVKVDIPDLITSNSTNYISIFTSEPATLTFSIIDILGRVCRYEQKLLNSGTNFVALDDILGYLPNGIYGIELKITSKKIRKTVLLINK